VKRIHLTKEIGVLSIIVLLMIVITLMNSSFLTADNLLDLIRNNSVLGIVAMGMLLVILTGGIDVSVGAQVAAVTIIIGTYMVNYGGNLFTVFLLASVAGIFLGVINGTLIAKLKIPPIVVTLGMMSVIHGLNLYYTNGTWITRIPSWFIDFGRVRLMGIPIQIFFLALVAVLTHYLLNYTIIGRGIYAIGGNPIAADRVGYKKDGLTIFLYGYLGFLVGIAAVVHTSIYRQVDPNAFNGFELNVVATVVLGGANILGGQGSVLGTLLGVLMLAVIQNGLILVRIPTFWQKVVVGLIILGAVSADVIQNKRRERSISQIDVEV